MNDLGKMILFGSIAGALSALIWGGISYVTGMEIGWIAWGIGFAVGVAIRLASEQQIGIVPGGLAIAIALLAIVGGKYLAVRLIVSHHFAKVGLDKVVDHIDAETIKLEIGDEIVQEYESQKKKLVWPKKLLPGEKPIGAAEFPPVVWKEAVRRFDKLTQEQKDDRARKIRATFQQHISNATDKALETGFTASFSGFDLLWFGLAALTAYRIGSGNVAES